MSPFISKVLYQWYIHLTESPKLIIFRKETERSNLCSRWLLYENWKSPEGCPLPITVSCCYTIVGVLLSHLVFKAQDTDSLITQMLCFYHDQCLVVDLITWHDGCWLSKTVTIAHWSSLWKFVQPKQNRQMLGCVSIELWTGAKHLFQLKHLQKWKPDFKLHKLSSYLPKDLLNKPH